MLRRAGISGTVLLLLVLSAFPVSAETEKEPYRERIPSAERMEKLREKDLYRYPTGEEKEEKVGKRGFFTRVETWLEDIIYSPVEDAMEHGYIIRYILMVGGVLLILFFLWKNGAVSMFRKEAQKQAQGHTPITSFELEEESPLRKARQAEKEGFLVDALRWRYIYIVQCLGEKGLVRKSSHRTDREYLADLKGSGFEEAFDELSRSFQLVRYGDRPLREDDYEDWKGRFKELERRVKQYVG
ncbi:MAG: DUF4129 domain-containing protein [Flavobacteriales bacterium]